MFHIEGDETKGRIIGREGRNIRALEAATGVEIIVDDTPDAITLSCFDAIRREICRLALHQLVTDGRIHPARIEEVVEKTKKMVEEEIIETGNTPEKQIPLAEQYQPVQTRGFWPRIAVLVLVVAGSGFGAKVFAAISLPTIMGSIW